MEELNQTFLILVGNLDSVNQVRFSDVQGGIADVATIGAVVENGFGGVTSSRSYSSKSYPLTDKNKDENQELTVEEAQAKAKVWKNSSYKFNNSFFFLSNSS